MSKLSWYERLVAECDAEIGAMYAKDAAQLTKRGVCPRCGKACETTTVLGVQLSACPCVPPYKFYAIDVSTWTKYVGEQQRLALEAQADDAIAQAKQRLEWVARAKGLQSTLAREMLDGSVGPKTLQDLQPTLSARLGHLKHGPGGSGLSGPCDADCRKCEAERAAKVDGLTPEQCLERWSWNRAKVEQFGPRASGSPMYTLTPAQVATAKQMHSDAADKTWSRVLRAKVEASRKADAGRAASVVNAWDPEDM